MGAPSAVFGGSACPQAAHSLVSSRARPSRGINMRAHCCFLEVSMGAPRAVLANFLRAANYTDAVAKGHPRHASIGDKFGSYPDRINHLRKLQLSHCSSWNSFAKRCWKSKTPTRQDMDERDAWAGRMPRRNNLLVLVYMCFRLLVQQHGLIPQYPSQAYPHSPPPGLSLVFEIGTGND
jgi:hypothetical protein